MRERRQDVRRTAEALQVSPATSRPGRHVQVIDLSPTGPQVQTDRPLRPGSLVHLRLVTDAATLSTAAHIIRCLVWAIHPEQGGTYRGTLRFDDRCARLNSSSSS